jgi:MFS family permease
VLAALVGAITIPLHALVLRNKPEQVGTCPDGVCGERPIRRGSGGRPVYSLRGALQSRSFRWLSLAFGLTMFVNVATTVLLIPLLLDRGESTRFAATAAAAIGLLALPGRLIFTPLGDFLPKFMVPALIFLTQAVALLVLAFSESHAGVWLFVLLFGIGFGAISPARASLVADLYGVAAFASISGVLALIVTLSRAAGPIGASLIDSLSDSDRLLLVVLAAMSAAAAGVVYRAVSSQSLVISR